MTSAKKWISVTLSIILFGVLLAACSSNSNNNKEPSTESQAPTASPTASASAEPSADPNQPVDGGNLTFSSFSDIVSVNPIYVSDTASGDAANFIYANIYDYDREGNVVVEPWSLASDKVQISEDGLTYTIKLKTTAKWSDGQPVTADDVIYTIDTVRNPDAGAPGISSYDKVDTITKVDDYTVQIKLKQVYAPFEYVLVSSVAPAHILKDIPVKELQDNAYGKDPAKTVTNGPWKWTEWKQTQYLTFDADPNYWGETKPHIQKITYKIYADQNTEVQALLKGDVDSTQAIPVTQVEAVKKDGNIRVSSKPGPTYEFMSFNFNKDNWKDGFVPFAGQKTRQAIATALNRQGMVDNVLKGTGALMNAPFLPGSWADPGDAAVNYPYDAEKAKQLLAEDGWVAGSDGILTKDGHRFSFELQYNSGNSRREQVSQIIQQNLKEVGIEVVPKAIDFAAWVDQNLNPGKYQAILLGWSLNNPDPDGESTFSSKYFPPNGQNMGWYKNEKLDKLWVDGYSTVNQDERKAIYKEIGTEISTDLPYVFLYQYSLPQGIGPRVHFADEDAPEPTLPYGYFFRAINWWVTDK
ncbi:ABC transporter substrate-binding protein [Paenibacillus protaetiae]|uniref:Peptide ABC transporter substrate-binding protein n=1 Tax=Paenibacillus protaetiae TaxID=2509456 RepID=A0A4P6EZM7_9BACL|nr:ABC transporter substrate-binding protein [Paenibacillus protaetiae]QAY68235.1 peptide ABC transporter substrate-binding protein [Paenibacillus protaetiae]